MTVLEALTRFTAAFGRAGNDFGLLQVLEQPRARQAELLVPGQLHDFYAYLEFQKLIVGGQFFIELFSLTKLPQAQLGRRWVVDPRSREVSENPNWSRDWLVFGDRNGDALVAQLSQPECPVFGSVQGRNYPLASSLASFFTILTECLVLEQTVFNFDTDQADLSPREDFLLAVQQLVAKRASAPELEGFMYFFFG